MSRHTLFPIGIFQGKAFQDEKRVVAWIELDKTVLFKTNASRKNHVAKTINGADFFFKKFKHGAALGRIAVIFHRRPASSRL